MGQTTISLDEDVADRLYDRKGRGESYNDVVVELLEAVEGRDDSTDTFDTDDLQGDASTTLDEPLESDAPFEEQLDAVADDILPGSGAKLEERRAALGAVVEHLREAGEATPSDFKSEVYPEHPGQYQTPRSWWKNAMYDGLVELAERTGAVERPDTSGRWSWRGHDLDEP